MIFFYPLFLLLAALSVAFVFYPHNPKKAWQKTISLVILVALWLLVMLFFFASEAQAATLGDPASQSCPWKIPFCAFGSFVQLPMYLSGFLILLAVATAITGVLCTKPLKDKLVQRLSHLNPSALLVVCMLVIIAILLGNTVLCYYLS